MESAPYSSGGVAGSAIQIFLCIFSILYDFLGGLSRDDHKILWLGVAFITRANPVKMCNFVQNHPLFCTKGSDDHI
jgi:hypothetical protein